MRSALEQVKIVLAELDKTRGTTMNHQETHPAWHQRAILGLAWAGSHAMRPQFAMGALFVLVIGSSLLLLRTRPVAITSTPLRVSEQTLTNTPPTAFGRPAPEKDMKRDTASPEREAEVALESATSVRDASGCDRAAPLFEMIMARFPASRAAVDATWEAATCYQKLEDKQRARELYITLRTSNAYAVRAEKELRRLAPAESTKAGLK